VLEFLGNGFVGSDYLDFIVRRGYEAEARQAFVSGLANERLVINWAQLRRGCFAAGVAAELGGTGDQGAPCAGTSAGPRGHPASTSACATGLRDGWNVSESVTNICPFIPLAGVSWEGYLATLGAEHRYNFNRKWRRLNRDYSVQFEQVDREEQCRESIDLVMELHNSRWRGRGGSDAFHTPGLVAFHREFSRLALKRGWLRLYVLRLNQKPAACLYGFLYGKTFYFYQSGLDPAFQKQSVGLVSMGLGIKSAIEEGAEEYDLLHGNEEYKSHWSGKSRELCRLELYPPGGVGRICRLSAELERASRRIARRVLTRMFV
jgi:CelD/BcsL family acetyltransferase involved in cellulose biosynthesis